MRLPPFPSISTLLSTLILGIIGLFIVVHEPFWVIFRAVFVVAAFGYVVVSLIALIIVRRRKSAMGQDRDGH